MLLFDEGGILIIENKDPMYNEINKNKLSLYSKYSYYHNKFYLKVNIQYNFQGDFYSHYAYQMIKSAKIINYLQKRIDKIKNRYELLDFD